MCITCGISKYKPHCLYLQFEGHLPKEKVFFIRSRKIEKDEIE